MLLSPFLICFPMFWFVCGHFMFKNRNCIIQFSLWEIGIWTHDFWLLADKALDHLAVFFSLKTWSFFVNLLIILFSNSWEKLSSQCYVENLLDFQLKIILLLSASVGRKIQMNFSLRLQTRFGRIFSFESFSHFPKSIS